MEKNSPERKAHCIEMVKFTVKKLSEILIRELEKDNKIKLEDLNNYKTRLTILYVLCLL